MGIAAGAGLFAALPRGCSPQAYHCLGTVSCAGLPTETAGPMVQEKTDCHSVSTACRSEASASDGNCVGSSFNRALCCTRRSSR